MISGCNREYSRYFVFIGSIIKIQSKIKPNYMRHATITYYNEMSKLIKMLALLSHKHINKNALLNYSLIFQAKEIKK